MFALPANRQESNTKLRLEAPQEPDSLPYPPKPANGCGALCEDVHAGVTKHQLSRAWGLPGDAKTAQAGRDAANEGTSGAMVAHVDLGKLGARTLRKETLVEDCESIVKEQLVAYVVHQQLPVQRWAWLWQLLSFIACVAVASIFILHLRLSTVHEITSSFEQSMQPTGLTGPGFSESAWAWLLASAEKQLVVPHTRIVAGTRLVRGSTGSSEALVRLCEYSAWNFLWDSLGAQGAPPEVVAPTACQNRSRDTAWVHWALRGDSAASLLGTTRAAWDGGFAAAGSNGFSIELLAHNSAANFYVIFGLILNIDPSGLPLAETRITAFDAAPAWLDFEADLQNGRWPTLILDAACIIVSVAFLTMRLMGMCRFCFGCCCKKRSGKRFCVWEGVDWLVFVALVPTVVLYACSTCLVSSLNGLVQDLPDLNVQQWCTQGQLEALLAVKGSTWHGYLEQLDVVLDQAHRAADTYSLCLCWAIFVSTCVYLRLCQALLLRHMTRMLTGSYDLANLLPLAGTVLLLFSLIGYLVYGGRAVAFSSAGGALESTLFALMGRSVSPAHRTAWHVGGALGALWPWFLVVATLLLSGCAAAVILDRQLGAAEWQSGHRPVCGRGHAQERRPAAGESPQERKLLEGLLGAAARLSPVLSSASLAHALDKQTPEALEQLRRLIRAAKGGAGADERSDVALLSDTTRLMARIDSNVHDLGGSIRAVAGCLDAFCGSERSKAGAATWQDPLQDDVPADGRLDDIFSNDHLFSKFGRPTEGSIAASDSPAPTCTDDFECEDIEPPPSPPVEEEDDGPLALAWPADIQDMLPLTGSATPVLEALPAGPLDDLELQCLALPPSPLPDMPTSIQPLADHLDGLDKSGAKRGGTLREYCANLECRLVSAAEQVEARVGVQVEALSKIESTLDQIIHGVGPLFEPS